MNLSGSGDACVYVEMKFGRAKYSKRGGCEVWCPGFGIQTTTWVFESVVKDKVNDAGMVQHVECHVWLG